ncbi:MAG: amidohydrolase family protein [Acidimicrobiales bacterium]
MARQEPPDPGLPIKLEPCGNGEFVPRPATPLARETVRRANDAVDRNARRVGMSRRDFLRSSLGAATTLTALAACTRESGQTGGTFVVDPESTTTAPTGGGGGSGGDTAPDVTLDAEAADRAVGAIDEEFIFDVQGHLLELEPGEAAPGFPQSACGEADPGDCYSIDHFLELVFVESDTHMAMLSAIPFASGALSPEVMERTMEAADGLGCRDRVLMQGESFPTSLGLDAMAAVAADFPVRAFKTYTHAGGPSWRLDDDVGDAYLEQVRAVGVPIVAVHKGLSGNDPASSPADIGPAAAGHPDIDLLVYHSGYESGLTEGPYDPSTADVGVNRLIASIEAAGIGPGGNVYAELGSTWRTLMTRPDEAAHLLGKLLLTVGEDNILWGTDSIWYGSPQDQIQAFRTFQITAEFQDRYGYPELTPDIKRKILGHNAARLFDIDPITERCTVDRDGLNRLRDERAASTHHTHAEAAARALAASQA